MTRVLLVEDEPDLGAALQAGLSQQKYVVDWLRDGLEAWDCLCRTDYQYHLAVLDWMLPGLSGLALCQRLRAQQRSLPVLILTARDRLEDKVAGLDAGADDYLVKPFKLPELLARLRALQRRTQPLQPQVLTVGQLILDYGQSSICLATTGKPIALTAKEFQILELLMQHPHQILSRDQILNQVWALDQTAISNVVAAHIRLLRQKLAQAGSAAVIETVYGLGYRLIDSVTLPTSPAPDTD
jgi:DNA-binding response OmpR family regulator